MRAEAYITQTVDSDGRPQHQGYGQFSQPRIVQMVDRYLGSHINEAIKKALGNAHTELASQIQTVVDRALKESGGKPVKIVAHKS